MLEHETIGITVTVASAFFSWNFFKHTRLISLIGFTALVMLYIPNLPGTTANTMAIASPTLLAVAIVIEIRTKLSKKSSP